MHKNGIPVSPVEYVATLSDEEKGAVLEALLKEALARYPGAGVLPFHAGDGQWLGNLVLPDQPVAPADRVYFELGPEMRQALMQPYIELDLDDTLSDEQVEAILRGAADPRSQ